MDLNIFNPPKYLACSSNEIPISERLDVLTSEKNIAALSAKMNKQIDALVTIVWDNDESRKLFRDDSYGISGELRPTCKLFKIYTKKDCGKINCNHNTCVENDCDKCDKYHYELLKSFMINENKLMGKPDFFPANYTTPELETDEDTNIKYIKYHCPMMGYLEYLFPIMIEKKFLGAVFVGQILFDQDNEAQKYFESYLQQSTRNHLSYQQIKHLKSIRKAECNETNDENSVESCFASYVKRINPNNYEQLRKKIINCFIDLIDELKIIMQEKREKTMHIAFQNILKDADKKCSDFDSKIISINMITDYEEVLREIFAEGMKPFGVKSIRILGLKRNPLLTPEYPMQLILSSIKEEKNRVFLWFNNQKEYKNKKIDTPPWEPNCSIEKGKIKFDQTFFDLFDSGNEGLSITGESYLAMVYPSWLVLIEVHSLSIYLDIYSSMLKVFKGIITAYLSRYELRLSKFVTDKYMLTLRLYRHECGNVATEIHTRNNNDYRKHINSIKEAKDIIKKGDKDFSYRYFIQSISDKNLESACDDVDDNVKLIIHMADTIGLITERITPSRLDKHEPCSDFSFGGDIVIKWVKANKNQRRIREQNIKIFVDNFRGFYDKETGFWEEKLIYHRKRLLDIVTYNLIDNALKYSHQGTNIYIKIGSEETKESSVFPFIIENYGTYIEPEPKAYEVYWRGSGKNNESKNENESEPTHVDGDGLGLYIVKTISEILGLNIKYKCNPDYKEPNKPICNFNIGLIKEYIKRGKDKVLVEHLRSEYVNRSKEFRKILNSIPQKPETDLPLSTDELENEIHIPTYHIVFEFQVHIKSIK